MFVKEYQVLFFGSLPSLENDDLWDGAEFDTLEEAKAFTQSEDPFKDHETCRNCTAFFSICEVEDDGITIKYKELEVIPNPNYSERKRDNEWAREASRQSFMMGCRG